jgi:hypothetical protein
MKKADPLRLRSRRFFGDDNQNGKDNSNSKGTAVASRMFTFPPFAMELRRMGHPVIRGW